MNKKKNACQNLKGFYPSFAPTITTAIKGKNNVVYITGTNFLPASYGTTYVNFGTYKNLEITFYNSYQISFVIPNNVTSGSYNLVVVNVYNTNFGSCINISDPGKQNYSNTFTFRV
jgi:uncharacterized protein (TIGR03437 family)